MASIRNSGRSVILCDRLAPQSTELDVDFSITPATDLLNRPYIDRLAAEYRSLGAREVLWAGSVPDELFKRGRSDTAAWRPLDHAWMRKGAAKRSETVLIADIRLWPGNDMKRVLSGRKHFLSDLVAFVRPRARGNYAEIIETPDTVANFTVTRRYHEPPHGEEGPPSVVALLAHPKSLGSAWEVLLKVGVSGDPGRVAAVTLKAAHQTISRPIWVESVEQYLLLVKQLLVGGDVREPEAKVIGKKVWVMPGATLDRDCTVEGPVLLGRNCRVSRGVRITGPAVIGDSVHVGEDCFVGESVLLKGAVMRSKARVWRSVIDVAQILEEAEGHAFGWLGEDTCRRHLLEASHHRFGSVVVPSRRLWRRCKHRLHPAIKRAMDVCGSAVGLVLTVPLYPFIAIAIKLDTSGPVFYAHRRQMLGGREFGCLKFRSMVTNADEMQQELSNEVDGPQFHMEDDPRLTRIGRFLRRTNLDEIPQFWNVLVGHMSLVGPRPSPDDENQYCPAWREARLSVRPGLTGLWQMNRSDRASGDFHEWIQYDVQYVREYSLWTDVKLLWATARRFAKCFGSPLGAPAPETVKVTTRELD